MLKKLHSCSLIWSLSCRLSHPNFHFEPVHVLLCGYSFREDLISLRQQGNSKPTNPTPNPLLGLTSVPSTSLLRSSVFPSPTPKACSEQRKTIWIVLIRKKKNKSNHPSFYLSDHVLWLQTCYAWPSCSRGFFLIASPYSRAPCSPAPTLSPGVTSGITAHVAALHQHLVGQKIRKPQLGRSTECLSRHTGPRHALLLLGLYNEWLSVTCYWPCTFTNIQKSGSLCSESLLHQVSYNIQLCVYKYTWNNTYCKYISIYTLISIHIQN